MGVIIVALGGGLAVACRWARRARGVHFGVGGGFCGF